MTKLIPTTVSAVSVGDYERRKVSHAFGVTLQTTRRAESLSPLDTICIYVRVGSVAFQPDEEGES